MLLLCREGSWDPKEEWVFGQWGTRHPYHGHSLRPLRNAETDEYS